MSASVATPPSAARPADSIRVSAAPQKPNPSLEQAFLAFNRGEMDLAQAAWQRVLESDPRNSDALYGLAAVALQHQQPNLAADYYLRALEANPKDALALSGLASLKGNADPQQTESRLKTLLAEQPDSPFLNFALGNLYARNIRWADAQQAYFRAHVADPRNPDYLFNLAVSLDQLRQSRLAIQYYNQALGAVTLQPVGFDPAQVAARLKILQAGQ
jgi:tetratricopeptide (TPR) repeat protein